MPNASGIPLEAGVRMHHVVMLPSHFHLDLCLNQIPGRSYGQVFVPKFRLSTFIGAVLPGRTRIDLRRVISYRRRSAECE